MTPYEIMALAGVAFLLCFICMIMLCLWYDVYRQQVYAARVLSSQEWIV
jgi:cbb3-type cytochrome oxidase subunit 3